MKITTMIVPFSLREVSLHFLLEINEDFDDDLLMEAVDLIEWPNKASLLIILIHCESLHFETPLEN